VNALKEERF